MTSKTEEQKLHDEKQKNLTPEQKLEQEALKRSLERGGNAVRDRIAKLEAQIAEIKQQHPEMSFDGEKPVKPVA